MLMLLKKRNLLLQVPCYTRLIALLSVTLTSRRLLKNAVLQMQHTVA